jgi:hypothetical protein
MSSQYPDGGIFVLVGGDGKDQQGCKHENRNFQHTSVPFIGSAYADLRRAGVDRDRIIVIAQVKDYLDDTLGLWLSQTASSDISQKQFIEGEIMRTKHACSVLLSEGGADYDGFDVNPGTVLNVLLGKQFQSSRTGNFGKVVPSTHRGVRC